MFKVILVTYVLKGRGKTTGVRQHRYRLLGILSYACVCHKSKMAAINRKWIGSYVYLSSYT